MVLSFTLAEVGYLGCNQAVGELGIGPDVPIRMLSSRRSTLCQLNSTECMQCAVRALDRTCHLSLAPECHGPLSRHFEPPLPMLYGTVERNETRTMLFPDSMGTRTGASGFCRCLRGCRLSGLLACQRILGICWRKCHGFRCQGALANTETSEKGVIVIQRLLPLSGHCRPEKKDIIIQGPASARPSSVPLCSTQQNFHRLLVTPIFVPVNTALY